MAQTPAGTLGYTQHRVNAFLDRLPTIADQTVFSYIERLFSRGSCQPV